MCFVSETAKVELNTDECKPLVSGGGYVRGRGRGWGRVRGTFAAAADERPAGAYRRPLLSST